jgi:predicted neuraminidase
MKFIFITFLFLSFSVSAQIKIDSTLVFPVQDKHVHSSSIVELPNGDLLLCWFKGSGERWANDVVIEGARLRKGELKWSRPFLMADTPGQPDCNPVMFLNNAGKLFLVWVVVQANQWENSILKVKTSSRYDKPGVPEWEWQDIVLMKPGDEFAKQVEEQFKKNAREDLTYAGYAPPYEELLTLAAKDPKKRETGWMTRTHPTFLQEGKVLLPLYSDGFNFGLVAISEDQGKTWQCSLPIVGRGLNQPSLVEKKDGSLVAYMRQDGDEPSKIMISYSNDQGYSWSFAERSELPNPGASVEVIKLKSGNWLLAYNDVEDGRYSLAVALSDDEGATWNWKRNIEFKKGSSFSYPSVIQAQDGKIHLTYSYHLGKDQESIKYMVFDEKWLKSGK